MKTAIVLLALVSGGFSQGVNSPTDPATRGLRLEVRTSSASLKMTDEIVLTVFFRSPEREVTIWNALGWGPSAGLYLQISDTSGRKVRNDYVQMFHPLPPDRSGRNALITVAGESFAGFDSRIPAATLFPAPGRYIVKCSYRPPLPRDYFQGHTIWGNEDGPIESVGVSVLVEK